MDTDLELDRDDINSLRQIMETTTSTSEMDLGLARLNWQNIAGALREKYPKGIGKLCEGYKMEARDNFCNTGAKHNRVRERLRRERSSKVCDIFTFG